MMTDVSEEDGVGTMGDKAALLHRNQHTLVRM